MAIQSHASMPSSEPITTTLKALFPIQVQLVYQTPLEPLWDQLVRNYHYLGYQQMLGARLKYIAFSQGRPLACLGFSSAMLQVTARDCFIGWSQTQKARYLPQVANHNRLLILPWVRVDNLASYLLARVLKVLAEDWQHFYRRRLLVVETYVDRARFQGTSYQAANWIFAGQTRGFAKQGPAYVYHGHPKDVYVYPLDRQFRTTIGCRQRPIPPRRPSIRKNVFEEGERQMMIQQNDWHPDLLGQAGISDDEVEKLGQALLDFHDQFADGFSRKEQRQLSEIYIKGLLSDAEEKSVEPIALRYLGPKKVRSLQMFLGKAKWDEDRVQQRYQEELSNLLAEEEAMVCLDESDFPKAGDNSVGVARQYCGRLGKVDNCQAGLFLSYASSKGYGFVDHQLYMPEKWFDDNHADQRQACHVPDDLSFQPKNELALALLKQLPTDLFPARWLGVDAGFGADHHLLQEVEKAGYIYFADTRCNSQVWLEKPHMRIPSYSGRGRPATKPKPSIPSMSVSDVAGQPGLPWHTVSLAEGAKGPIMAEVARVRVFPKDPEGYPEAERWLYLRKRTDGKIKYAFSNASPDCPFEDMNHVATLRWSIEQCFKEGKSHLGMDQYEIRSWQGWHRHMLYVFLAQLFLLEVRFTFKKNAYFNPASG